MQERINVDALIESALKTPKSHIRSLSKISQATLKEIPLSAEEWNARIEENEKFVTAEWKV